MSAPPALCPVSPGVPQCPLVLRGHRHSPGHGPRPGSCSQAGRAAGPMPVLPGCPFSREFKKCKRSPRLARELSEHRSEQRGGGGRSHGHRLHGANLAAAQRAGNVYEKNNYNKISESESPVVTRTRPEPPHLREAPSSALLAWHRWLGACPGSWFTSAPRDLAVWSGVPAK